LGYTAHTAVLRVKILVFLFLPDKGVKINCTEKGGGVKLPDIQGTMPEEHKPLLFRAKTMGAGEETEEETEDEGGGKSLRSQSLDTGVK
jgi:hypothetical protein